MFDLKKWFEEHKVECNTRDDRAIVRNIIAQYYPDDNLEYIEDRWLPATWPYLHYYQGWCLNSTSEGTIVSVNEFLTVVQISDEPELEVENLNSIL